MQAKNLSSDEGGLVKKLLFPSFADAGSNDAFLPSVNQNIHQKKDCKDTIKSQPSSVAPPKEHNVDHNVHAPSGNPNTTLFSDGGSVYSPLEPQKLLSENLVSKSPNVSVDMSRDMSMSVDMSRDMSMIVNTGACVEKQNESMNIAETSIIEEDGFENMEEKRADEKEDEFIDSIKGLASPIHRKEDEESENTRTPIGTSIVSPPKMSRLAEVQGDKNPLTYNSQANSSESDGGTLSQKVDVNDSQSTNNKSPVHHASTSHLLRTQSYGEQSETTSSLLGCNLLGKEEKLLHGVTKQCGTQSNKADKDDRQEKPIPEKMTKDCGESHDKESMKKKQIIDHTTAILSKLDHVIGGDDDSSCDANSLISEYGSDIGDLKIRLDDVYAMAAVEEEEEEDATNSVDMNQGGESHTESDLESLHIQPRIKTDNEESNKENCVNYSQRMASPNLLWSETGIEIENCKGKFDYLKPKGLSLPASPVQRDSNSSATPTTPIAAVSAAFRRIGNGVSNIARGGKSPDPILNVEYPENKCSSKSERIQLSPTLGSLSFRKTPKKESHMSSPAKMMQSVRKQISSPLQHATGGCLSFVPESGLPPYANMLKINDSPPASPILPKRSQFKARSTGHSSPLRFKSISWEAESNRVCDNQCDRITDINIEMNRRKVIQHKPGSNFLSGLSATSTGTAFRNNGGSILIREGQSFQPAITPSRKRQIIDSSLNFNEKAESVSPTILLQSPQRVGDVEKEDAFDILALLVERSIAFHEKKDQLLSSGGVKQEDSLSNDYSVQSDNSICSQRLGDNPSSMITTSPENFRKENIADIKQARLSSSVSNIQNSIEELRVISKNHNHDSAMAANHSSRMVALNELQRSYTYALEMKRAALSASTWLRAIGRSDKNDGCNSATSFFTDRHSNDEIKQHSALNINNFVIDERMKMKPDSLRQALQSDQIQLAAKDELNKRLDHELSVCRAEIGRLKSLSRSENVFVSPNKSILDEEGDDSSASSEEGQIFRSETGTNISFLEIGDTKDMDVSQDLSVSQTLLSTVESKREVLLLKAELAMANKKIISMGDEMDKLRQKHSLVENPISIDTTEIVTDSQSEEKESCNKNADKDTATVQDDVTGQVEDDDSCKISFSNVLLRKDLDSYVEAIRKADKAKIDHLSRRLEESNQLNEKDEKIDEKMINVRMLDGENFVTEWTKLGPLPPPPEHDINSPIVTGLLSQWTDNNSTRDALIAWMKNVLGGADPNSVPPLKLSSLDHQVRDGFTMHILPLLLRRSDLYLEVTSRAHRRTSYDIIATVKNTQSILCDSKSQPSQNNPNISTETSLRNHVSGPYMMAFKASGGINASNESLGECSLAKDKHKLTSHVSDHSDEIDSGSVTHSSITEFISNQISISTHLDRRATNSQTPVHSSNVAGDDSPAGSTRLDSPKHKNQPQSSMMAGAINAVGGLLSRRKHNQSPQPSHQGASLEDKHHRLHNQYNPPDSAYLPTLGKSPTKKFNNPFPVLSSSTLARGRADPPKSTTLIENLEEDQPYHRVVSAPPGRIGMTFVQYRGHAIVSDVYQNSPLHGWVFPSDILIAIDEVPVSGRRVLEIVKLLNARKDRQRALRVISSHAMTDLIITQNSAALMDG